MIQSRDFVPFAQIPLHLKVLHGRQPLGKAGASGQKQHKKQKYFFIFIPLHYSSRKLTYCKLLQNQRNNYVVFHAIQRGISKWHD